MGSSLGGLFLSNICSSKIDILQGVNNCVISSNLLSLNLSNVVDDWYASVGNVKNVVGCINKDVLLMRVPG